MTKTQKLRIVYLTSMDEYITMINLKPIGMVETEKRALGRDLMILQGRR